MKVQVTCRFGFAWFMGKAEPPPPSTSHGRSILRWFIVSVLLCLFPLVATAHGGMTVCASQKLPFGGDGQQLIGDLVYAGGGAAAVYERPDGTALRLMFYRFGPNAQTLVERQHASALYNFYTPALCWDGQDFAVVSPTLTQAVFLTLSPAGDILLGPVQLPGLPSGADVGRTAAFRVLWTGTTYAVFGLWLEKQYPLQDLTRGNFYTHLHYWQLNDAGQTLNHQVLGHLAPMTYPGSEGAEKNYYDVVWTGQKFFLVYYAESQTGPPFSIYYKLYDLTGQLLVDEKRAFANQTAQGPKLAWNGRTIGLTGLKVISLPSPDAGNYMYLRCFDPNGVPLAVETAYGQKLGFGPTIFWADSKFVTVYCTMYNMMNLGYSLLLNAFDEVGQKIGAETVLSTPQGGALSGTMALGVDLHIVGGDNLFFCKSQTSDAWMLSSNPLLLVFSDVALLAPRLTLNRNGNQIQFLWPANPAGFILQETPSLSVPNWTATVGTPLLQNGQYALTQAPIGTKFYRLSK